MLKCRSTEIQTHRKKNDRNKDIQKYRITDLLIHKYRKKNSNRIWIPCKNKKVNDIYLKNQFKQIYGQYRVI